MIDVESEECPHSYQEILRYEREQDEYVPEEPAPPKSHRTPKFLCACGCEASIDLVTAVRITLPSGTCVRGQPKLRRAARNEYFFLPGHEPDAPGSGRFQLAEVVTVAYSRSFDLEKGTIVSFTRFKTYTGMISRTDMPDVMTLRFFDASGDSETQYARNKETGWWDVDVSRPVEIRRAEVKETRAFYADRKAHVAGLKR